jgi:hypothetical protein
VGKKEYTAAEALRLVTEDPMRSLGDIFAPEPSLDDLRASVLEVRHLLSATPAEPVSDNFLPRLPGYSVDQLLQMGAEAEADLEKAMMKLPPARDSLTRTTKRLERSLRSAVQVNERFIEQHKTHRAALDAFRECARNVDENTLLARIIRIEIDSKEQTVA